MNRNIDDTVLIGWKAIASALGRSPEAARRYFETKGLPVGFPGGRRATAYLSHIQAWMLTQGRNPDNAESFKNLERYRDSVKFKAW